MLKDFKVIRKYTYLKTLTTSMLNNYIDSIKLGIWNTEHMPCIKEKNILLK